MDIDRESALDAVDDDGIDRLLLVDVSATVFFSTILPWVAAPNTFISLPPSIGVESEFCPPLWRSESSHQRD